MKKKFNVNILMRIAALVVLCLVALGVATAMNLSAMSSTRMQDRQDQLVALAATAYNVVAGYAKQVEAGQLTDDAAQKAATATLSTSSASSNHPRVFRTRETSAFIARG